MSPRVLESSSPGIHIKHPFLTRLISFLVVEVFLCSSVLPVGAGPQEWLRPPLDGSKVLVNALARDGGDVGDEEIQAFFDALNQILFTELKDYAKLVTWSFYKRVVGNNSNIKLGSRKEPAGLQEKIDALHARFESVIDLLVWDPHYGNVLYAPEGDTVLLLGYSASGKTSLSWELIDLFDYRFGYDDAAHTFSIPGRRVYASSAYKTGVIHPTNGIRNIKREFRNPEARIAEVRAIVILRDWDGQKPVASPSDDISENRKLLREVGSAIDPEGIRFITAWVPRQRAPETYETLASDVHAILTSGGGVHGPKAARDGGLRRINIPKPSRQMNPSQMPFLKLPTYP